MAQVETARDNLFLGRSGKVHAAKGTSRQEYQEQIHVLRKMVICVLLQQPGIDMASRFGLELTLTVGLL